jgi:hypothetical protein
MDWVCDNEWKTSFSQSLFFAGAAVGTLMFGWITDQFGRFRVRGRPSMTSHIHFNPLAYQFNSTRVLQLKLNK